MRIGIFETEHFEGAYPVIKLFDNGNNEITIFTFPKPHRQFQHLFKNEYDRYQWIVKPEFSSKYRFMVHVFRECRQRNIELMYFNTVSDNHLFYAWIIRLLRPVRVVLTLHDINSHFRFKPAFSLRRWVRFFGKRALVCTVREFNVVSVTMTDYLRQRLPRNRKVHAVPGAVYEGMHFRVPSPAQAGSINIVVPGTIDVRRRDYGQVFELLDDCRRQSIPVTIVLLGGYYGEAGRQVIEKCKSYSLKHTNLRYYETDVVDQPEFDKGMNEAHLVFIPSRIDTVFSEGVRETYGLSISSGNIFDIIKHAKPFIAPVALHIPANLQTSALQYSKVPDITDMLRRLMTDENYYREIAEKALLNSGEYTIEKIREKNITLFGP